MAPHSFLFFNSEACTLTENRLVASLNFIESNAAN
jgi:hypothetical protein